MISILTILLGFVTGWAVACEYSSRVTAQRLLLIEQERKAEQQAARDREFALIDRLLRRNQTQPLVEREQVFKLPDLEATRPRNEWEEAMRLDEIKEALEEVQPGAAWVSAEEAKATWPDLWKQQEAKWNAERTPLRV